MSESSKTNEESKVLDSLLDDALTDFNTISTTVKEEHVISSAETAPPPSDPIQSTFEAMCFNDEKFLNELDALPNMLSNFPFGLGETTNDNDADNNHIFNLFSQLGKHTDLLQKIKDEDIEKALEQLADQPTTASASSTTTTNEPHVEQLNLFMSSILSKDVMLPSNDNQQIQRVLQKFQQLQTHGDPPKELLFFPGLPGFGGFGSGDQNLFDDAFSEADKVGQNQSECCLM